MSELADQVRSYWDADSVTYDDTTGHHPRTALERAAWAAALCRLLPAPPARVLDVGAGTGFLTLLLASQGYDVTALDLSPGMLERLDGKAAAQGLAVSVVEADAVHPPHGDFDAVVERHLLWTLPDPRAALAAWREASPGGTLVLLESLWGAAGGRPEWARSKARSLLSRLRHEHGSHHAEYDAAVRALLPLADGTSPEQLAALVESTGWGATRLERLRDVEWAARRALPSVADRLVGLAPRFAVSAGRAGAG